MQTSSAFGLGLKLNVALQGLARLEVADRLDVAVHIGTFPEAISDRLAEPWTEYHVSEDTDEVGQPLARIARSRDGSLHCIDYSDGTMVLIDASGTAVWAQGARDATIEDTGTYLLGPVLGFLLRLRGVVCLHASAVVVDGKAIAFAGPRGAGKSSIAAAFARAGYAVLGDDVAPLDERGHRFEVRPACPRLRLWPDSASSLFGSPDALPRISPTWDKRYLDLLGPGVRFEERPVALGAVYVIGERDVNASASRIIPLEGPRALMSLVGESFATRLLGRDQRAREFEVLGRLAECVPVRGLLLRDELAGIARLPEAILQDFRALHAGRA